MLEYYKKLQTTTKPKETTIITRERNNNNNNIIKIHMYQGNEKMKKTCPKASERRQLTELPITPGVESPPSLSRIESFLELYKIGWRSKLIMHSYLVIRVKLAIISKNTHTGSLASCSVSGMRPEALSSPFNSKALFQTVPSTLCSTAHTVF